MSAQEIPLDLIASSKTGAVVSTESGLSVSEDASEITEASATYDNVSGTLTLKLPTIGTLTVEGFLKQSDIGSGPQGDTGANGTPGLDGLTPRDGQRGADGCIGADGPIGATGKEGARGQQGAQGLQGPQGSQGEQGADGKFSVYYQTEDPGAVGAGSIWLRPNAV